MGNHAAVLIYTLQDPRNGEIYYVGQCRHVRTRLRSHIRASRSPKYPVQFRTAQIIASGTEPAIKVIETSPYTAWEEKERYWIARMRSEGVPILNLASGGQGPDAELNVRGIEHYRTHLTEEDILTIRSERLKGVSLSSLAEKYGLALSTIGLICQGKNWRHVGGDLSSGHLSPAAGERNAKAKLTADLVVQMRVERSQGKTCEELALRYGIKRAAVSRACLGHSWRSAGGPITCEYSERRGKLPPRCKISADEARQIKQLLQDGQLTQTQIGNQFGVTNGLVSHIKLGIAWKDA